MSWFHGHFAWVDISIHPGGRRGGLLRLGGDLLPRWTLRPKGCACVSRPFAVGSDADPARNTEVNEACEILAEGAGRQGCVIRWVLPLTEATVMWLLRPQAICTPQPPFCPQNSPRRLRIKMLYSQFNCLRGLQELSASFVTIAQWPCCTPHTTVSSTRSDLSLCFLCWRDAWVAAVADAFAPPPSPPPKSKDQVQPQADVRGPELEPAKAGRQHRWPTIGGQHRGLLRKTEVGVRGGPCRPERAASGFLFHLLGRNQSLMRGRSRMCSKGVGGEGERWSG